jgi:hypothetical protein
MDKQKEISKIQNALQIPITDIQFNTDNVQIISGTKHIGGIPYYSVAGIITYDNSENVVNWLNWVAVYLQNKNEIDQLIINSVATDKIIISYGTFRNLYVKNQNDDTLICKVNCSYADKWTVTQTK